MSAYMGCKSMLTTTCAGCCAYGAYGAYCGSYGAYCGSASRGSARCRAVARPCRNAAMVCLLATHFLKNLSHSTFEIKPSPDRSISYSSAASTSRGRSPPSKKYNSKHAANASSGTAAPWQPACACIAEKTRSSGGVAAAAGPRGACSRPWIWASWASSESSLSCVFIVADSVAASESSVAACASASRKSRKAAFNSKTDCLARSKSRWNVADASIFVTRQCAS
mmetsp:Transcript_27213/g.91472  ORF Transcript_27213/g.91472 Transcript_27213/m.91472 type:complete len:224 (-) Transcript_27213:290-961(-)